jgi:4-hydroxy-4-methyl-2-oxoglutarate aldolase
MMTNNQISGAFTDLSTPLVADAVVRLRLPVRVAPREIRAFVGTRIAGRVLPAIDAGSVDVFLEAIEHASPGDVLVIDNSGRTDEGCIGDLVAIEASTQGLGGVVVWGMHRDSRELAAIGLPMFSCGVCPNGPLRARERDADALTRARLGWQLVDRTDTVFGDLDGVVFVNDQHLDDVIDVAREIAERERQQASLVRQGRSLREQFRLAEYVRRRREDPRHTFRQHLRGLGGTIEE